MILNIEKIKKKKKEKFDSAQVIELKIRLIKYDLSIEKKKKKKN